MAGLLLNQKYYPKTYRKSDINEIVNRIIKFQPLTLVGLPRVGLARILRFLLVHPELLSQKLKSKKVLLIEIDINDLFTLKEVSFWQLILKRIKDNSKVKEIDDLYLSATQAKDAFTFFDNTKQSISQLCTKEYSVFLFFNRFDRAFPFFSYLFFSHLQSLKDIAKTKINFLFTSNRPLEHLFSDIFKGGNLEVFSQKYYLKPASRVDLLPIINEFKKSRQTKLNKKTKEVVYQYSGGHAQYALLVLQALEKNSYSLENTDSYLKNDLPLFEQGKEIWDFLNSEEKSLIVAEKKVPLDHFLAQIGLIDSSGKLFNPLFEHFVKTQGALEKTSLKELTKKEKSLLSILTSRKGELVTREEIINFVWPENPEEVNDWAIDQLVKRLRKKLFLSKKEYEIKTIKNQGYKLLKR